MKALGTQPGWHLLTRDEPPRGTGLFEPADLALAEVDPTGRILRISGLNTPYWGWRSGEQIAEGVLDQLRGLPTDTMQSVPTDKGSLLLQGLSREPEAGWLVIGCAENETAKASASTFKSLIEKGPAYRLRLDATGRVQQMGPRIASLLEHPQEQIIGAPLSLNVVHPEDRWKLNEAIRRVREEVRQVALSVRFLTQSQDLRFAQLYLVPTLAETPVQIDVLAFDVTEETGLETMLLHSEALYRTFLEQSPMGILHLDASGMVTFENHPFRQIVGEAVEDAWIGRRVEDISGLDAHLKPLVARMLNEGQSIQAVDASYRRAEAHLPVRLVVHGSPIRQPGGEIVGGVLMIEDVTEQRQREEELLLRDRYERAEMALRDVVLTDLSEDLFLHNAAAIFGETSNADRVHLLVHIGTEGHVSTRATWGRDTGEEVYSLYVRTGDYPRLRSAVINGNNLHLHAGNVSDAARALLDISEAEEAVWAPFYDTGRFGGVALFERSQLPTEASVGFWSHIEQRLMDRLIRLFETLWSWIQVGQRYRLTVATIDDCLFTCSFARDGSRRYLFITPQVLEMTGYGADEVLARSDAVFSWADTVVHPDDLAAFRAHEKALRNGHESRLTYRIGHKAGTYRWLSEQATPHRDATGRITVSGILTDMTEQKENEEILLSAREQVASASRIKSTFVSTMSHELRTPLGAINGFAELLTTELSEWEAKTGHTLPPQVGEFAEAVRQNASRLLQLTDDLFMLSNLDMGTLQLERTTVALHPVVRRCVGRVAVQLAEKDVRLQLDLAVADLFVMGDAGRIEKVLCHVLSNAAKFTDQGAVSVRTRRINDEVEIQVRDTGIGINAAYMDDLFTPFRQADNRLNRRFEGTGLGLALTKRLLDLMGGRIEVESEVGTGSTFRVFLPAG